MNHLFLDIEYTPKLVATFDMFDTNIPLYHLIQDSFVVSVSWAWNMGDVKNVNVLDDPKRFIENHTDDYHVLKTVYDEVCKADVIVGHYVKGFDWKILTGLFLLHDFPPLEKKSVVDTLAEAKKYKFTSNKLDFLSKKLGYSPKIEHKPDMMLKCAQGDVLAIRECAKYNDGDIPNMRSLFYRFRPYSHSTQYPNMQKVHGDLCCDRCGGVNVHKRGFNLLGKQLYACLDCRRRAPLKEYT